jgi:hypothetical protein
MYGKDRATWWAAIRLSHQARRISLDRKMGLPQRISRTISSTGYAVVGDQQILSEEA